MPGMYGLPFFRTNISLVGEKVGKKKKSKQHYTSAGIINVSSAGGPLLLFSCFPCQGIAVGPRPN